MSTTQVAAAARVVRNRAENLDLPTSFSIESTRSGCGSLLGGSLASTPECRFQSRITSPSFRRVTWPCSLITLVGAHSLTCRSKSEPSAARQSQAAPGSTCVGSLVAGPVRLDLCLSHPGAHPPQRACQRHLNSMRLHFEHASDLARSQVPAVT